MKQRFQGQNFRSSLRSARGYTRQPNKAVAKKWNFAFLKSRFFWYPLFVLGFLACMVYLPGYFSSHAVQVQGDDQELSARLEEKLALALSGRGALTYIPKNNLLFLNKNHLQEQLYKDFPEVFHLTVVKQAWSGSLSVSFERKYETFSFKVNSESFVLDQEAAVSSMALPPTSTTPILPVEMNFEGMEGTREQVLFSVEQEALKKIRQIFTSQKNFTFPSRVVLYPVTVTEYVAPEQKEGESVVQMPVAQTKVLNEPAQGFSLYTKLSGEQNSELEIKLPVGEELDAAIEKLALILEQKGVATLAGLAYADFRFEDKAFLCPKSEACARKGEVLPAAVEAVPEEQVKVE